MKNCYKVMWICQVVDIQVTAIISPFPCWSVVKTEIQFSNVLCTTVRFLRYRMMPNLTWVAGSTIEEGKLR